MAQQNSGNEPAYNLFSPEAQADPYPLYHRLRREVPVYWHPQMNGWLLTRYADVASALSHPQIIPQRGRTNKENVARLPTDEQRVMAAIGDFTALWLLFMPPVDHLRLRRLLNQGFKPGLVKGLRPRIQAITDALLDEIQTGDPVDIIEALAYPLPVMVIAEMLGVPTSDRVVVRGWAEKMRDFFNQGPRDSQARAAGMYEAIMAMSDYLGRLVAERRREPQDDIITSLLTAQDEQGALSQAELISNCGLMLFAGHETTMNLIGNGLLALLRHPDQYHKLVDQPALIPAAVEEFLRYDCPVQFSGRVAAADLEIGGQLIEAGQGIRLCLGAANRDPAQFPDPDRLDITRSHNDHLAFGYGAHFCLGAPLARLEGEIAFGTLLRRLPGLQLAAPTVTWHRGFSLRGLEALPVTYEEVRPA